jgi:soluble lytic murein transglycosylase-like protein
MFDTEIAASAQLYNVPETWVRAVIDTESSWRPMAYRAEPQISDASYGLMQLLTRTAKGLGYTGAPEGLYDPATNIDLGTKLLGQLRRSYGDDFRRVYSAYNSGKPDTWLTSTQVAANVTRALGNLEKWLNTEVSALTASPAGSGVAVLIAFVLLWAWGGKRGK